MAQAQSGEGRTFLTVDEAAETLGCSRLRVREAVARGLLKGRKDNEGRLRVDLPKKLRVVPDKGAPLEPDAIMAFLFDDIEDLEGALATRDAQIAALSALVERQGAALDQAGEALTEAEDQKARLAATLDRAFALLEAAPSPETVARMQGLLDRAMTVAEQGSAADQRTDRAMSLLDAALAQAEAGQSAQGATSQMLERALGAAERIQTELDATKDRLRDQEASMEKAIAMSERAVALANKRETAERKGFFRWLFGV